MILSFLFYAFVCYLLYRLLFDFILPVYKTTQKVRKSFRQMHEQMNQPNTNSYQNTQQTAQRHSNTSTDGGEYIDFEEIK